MDHALPVLVVDNDSDELSLLSGWLSNAGYEPILAEDLRGGLRNLYEYHPDAIIFSADELGATWSVIEHIRQLCDTPIILITSRSTRAHLHKAFDLGLDGYLVKPVRAEALLDRLAAALRKANRHNGSADIFIHENLMVDWKRLDVRLDDRQVHLTPLEFRLLAFLIKYQGWVVTYDEILTNVWGPNYIGDNSNVKLYIWYLRRKLEPDPSRPRRILTRYGVGYMFADELSQRVAEDNQEYSRPLRSSRPSAAPGRFSQPGAPLSVLKTPVAR